MTAAARALLALLLLLSGVLALTPPTQVALTGVDVYRRALPAVGWIITADRAKGTGWVVDRERRLMVTCAHVVGDSVTADVVFPAVRAGRVVAERSWYLEHLPELQRRGEAVRARVVRRDGANDLALLALDALPPAAAALPLAGGVRPGERVHALGCRYDSDVLWGHTHGVVQQVHTLRDGYFTAGQQLAKGTRVVVAQAPINEGDSGGPLLNERGAVVGVAAAVAWEAQGSGLFIDVSHVRALLAAKENEPPLRATAPGVTRYRQLCRSVAWVQGAAVDRRATALVIDPDRGLLLTTAEAVGTRRALQATFPILRDDAVVAEASYYRAHERELSRRKLRVSGIVLALDARRNLALLDAAETPAGTAAIGFADRPPAPGTPVHVVSNPARLDMLWLYAAGHVRQLGRAYLGQTADGPEPAVALLQAPFPEGEGGAPVVDDDGKLIAIVSGKTNPQQQLCYGVLASEVRAFLAETAPLAQPRSAADHAARGERFSAARQYARAAQAFTTALRLDPGHADALRGRGRVYLWLGQGSDALADCDAALKLNPRRAPTLVQRAEVYLALHEPRRALADCDAALRLDPRSASAFALRGRARGMLGDRLGGVADCGEAIWHDRRSALAYLCRAELHASAADLDAALADFTRAAQLDDHDPEPLRRRAGLHWARRDLSAALADYDAVAALDPADAAAHCGRAAALAARGDAAGAWAALGAAARCFLAP